VSGRVPERRPTYVPLEFGPGERAEFDFGAAAVEIAGQMCSVPFLVGRLRFSGALFLQVFPTQRQEAFLLGQRHAFELWGGVPRSAVYDNLKAAVAQILEGHNRSEHERFFHLRSVYRCEALFANVRSGSRERQRRESGGLRAPDLLGPHPAGREPRRAPSP
jgi:transposase